MFNDLMDNIEWFFNIHDKNRDGFLSKDEVLTLSESMLVSVPPAPHATGYSWLTESLQVHLQARAWGCVFGRD